MKKKKVRKRRSNKDHDTTATKNTIASDNSSWFQAISLSPYNKREATEKKEHKRQHFLLAFTSHLFNALHTLTQHSIFSRCVRSFGVLCVRGTISFGSHALSPMEMIQEAKQQKQQVTMQMIPKRITRSIHTHSLLGSQHTMRVNIMKKAMAWCS